jgi:hypothetical protein
MQYLVKYILIASALFLLSSCHSDVPNLPGYPEAKFCKSDKFKGCKNIDEGEITEEECKSAVVGGTIVTGSCE